MLLAWRFEVSPRSWPPLTKSWLHSHKTFDSSRSNTISSTAEGRSGSRGRRRKILSHDVLGAGARNRESRSVVPGVFTSQADGRGSDGKAIALQLQRVCAEKNQRVAEAEELPRRRIRRRSSRGPGQIESSCEIVNPFPSPRTVCTSPIPASPLH